MKVRREPRFRRQEIPHRDERYFVLSETVSNFGHTFVEKESQDETACLLSSSEEKKAGICCTPFSFLRLIHVLFPFIFTLNYHLLSCKGKTGENFICSAGCSSWSAIQFKGKIMPKKDTRRKGLSLQRTVLESVPCNFQTTTILYFYVSAF